jgi:creatinine amidohydrolase
LARIPIDDARPSRFSPAGRRGKTEVDVALGPLMATMTWREIEQAVTEGYVPVLPIGATEQHGPHLPLATDTILPTELTKLAAREVKILIPPPLAFGFKSKARSGGGQGFPGTISLDGETLIRLVRDVVSELARHGFRQIVLLNWHMENVNFVWEGIDQARAAGRVNGVTVMSIDSLTGSLMHEDLTWLFDQGFPGWDVEHAAIVETSLMLALRPELVRLEEISDDAPEEHPWYDLVPEPRRHVPTSGVLSRASPASPEKGERLRDLLVARLVEAIVKEFGAGREGPDRVSQAAEA